MNIGDVGDLGSCAICGKTEGDASNLTSQASFQTNATVRCGHQLYVTTNRLNTTGSVFVCRFGH
jgi:hypothetical protein